MVLAAQQADMGEADKALKDVRAMLKGNANQRTPMTARFTSRWRR